MIKVTNLTKIFKKPIRKEGFIGMFKTLFSRKYQEITAVNAINFNIDDGEIVGYIGSNGAGKSTTIKMMCGILHPTSGQVEIDGLDVIKNRKKVCKNIGVVFGQKTQLWWDIPLIETFKILKEVYEVPDDEYNEKLQYLKELLDIESFINQPVRTLSLGQRMRADFAASLIHNPKILFLDEPTIGLDVLVKDKIRNAIKELNKKYKTTIILTTHDMKDIEELCNRIIIIDKGNIIYDGNIKDIKNTFGNQKTIAIPLSNSNFQIDNYETFNNKLTYEAIDNQLLIKFNQDDIHFDIVMEYVLKTFKPEDIKLSQISIEDIAKSLYAKEDKNIL